MDAQRGEGVSGARRLVLALAAAVALAVFVAACGGDDGDDGGGGDTNGEQVACSGSIGVMAPITGDAAELGQEQLHWAEFAVDRFNQENGTDFTVEEGDTQLDPAQASTVAQQFVSNDDILAVVGPAGSDEVDAVGPVFERATLAAVSQSATASSLTEDGKYPTFSRVVPPDSVQGPNDAQYMIDELGAGRVLIVDDQTTYSTGLAESAQSTLEDAGVTVDTESVSQKQRDFSSIVSGIADDTDVVFLPWQLAASAQQFGEQMAEQGKDAVIVGTDGLFSPDEFTIDGSVVSSFAPDIRGIPDDADLVKAYQDKYGDFGTFGPPAFAAATVIMTAIQSLCEAGDDPTREAVADAIRETDLSESILGQPITFDENGDLEGAKFFLFEIENGKYRLAE